MAGFIGTRVEGGRTIEEAKDMAVEALTGHLEVMQEMGEAVPDPSSLDEVMRNSKFQDGPAFLMSIKRRRKRYL